MEASKRRAKPSSLELPDGVLVRVFEIVGVGALGASSAATRQWRRAAHTRALWQGLLQQRWPALWASLDAPQHVDARAMYRRLACPRVWRPTTPSEVTLSLDIETCSSAERDIMAEGFSRMLNLASPLNWSEVT